MSSRYDELHDRFHQIASGKAGTRYEVLAAFVFKALEEEGAVIHDMKLAGESGVQHQIDVLVEKDGHKKRILIECKDLDDTDAKVGLGRVRDFRSVVEDIKPDAAWMVTTKGFTSSAAKFAASKGIRTAVLREATEEEKGAGVAVVGVELRLSVVQDFQLSFGLGTQENLDRLRAALADLGLPASALVNFEHQPVYVRVGPEQARLGDFLKQRREAIGTHEIGENSFKENLEDAWLVVGTAPPIPLAGYRLTYQVVEMELTQLRVRGREVAMLVLEELSGTSHVITDVTLENLAKDKETGTIKSR